jgi:hypothetical protein
MGKKCSTNEGGEKCMQNFSWKFLKWRNNSESHYVTTRITFNFTFKKTIIKRILKERGMFLELRSSGAGHAMMAGSCKINRFI